jgi:hypothetical protein
MSILAIVTMAILNLFFIISCHRSNSIWESFFSFHLFISCCVSFLLPSFLCFFLSYVCILLFVLLLPSFLCEQSYGFEDLACHIKAINFCVLSMHVVYFARFWKKPYVFAHIWHLCLMALGLCMIEAILELMW